MKRDALTTGQMLMARRLLQWSRDHLAARMGVSAKAIGRFENDGLAVGAFDAQKAREVLEGAGIEFMAENGGGAGVRLKEEK